MALHHHFSMKSIYTAVFLTVLYLTLTSVEQVTCKDTRMSKCSIRPRPVLKSGFRIVGGKRAIPGEIPWQVYVANGPIIPSSLSLDLKCGGTVIHEQWILTAAHCEISLKDPVVSVVSGTLDTNEGINREASKAWQRLTVEQFISHEKFNNYTRENDIALLKLNGYLRFDDHTQPVCLARPDYDVTEGICKASGWGYYDFENEKKSCDLQAVDLPLIPVNICKAMLSAIDETNVVFSSNICTLSTKGVRDACSGDSGGPLVCRRSNGQFVQVGVISWGVGCAKKNVPGVYTKVSDFFNWIEQKTGLQL